jgi:hypothetical protein
MKSLLLLNVLGFLALPYSPLLAAELEVKINGSMPSVTVPTKDGPVKIMRNQNQTATINPTYAKTSRKCPPFCIQPMEVAPGITTVGEVELLKFAKSGGKLIDGRTVKWHLDGTIPGAINMPYTQMKNGIVQTLKKFCYFVMDLGAANHRWPLKRCFGKDTQQKKFFTTVAECRHGISLV